MKKWYDEEYEFITSEHALRVLRVMEAALESDRIGEVVHFDA